MTSADSPAPLPGTPADANADAWAPTERLQRQPDAAPAPRRPLPSNALPAGTELSEYTVLRVLGEGGFGIVYLAVDRYLNREVAIKEYMPSSLALRQDGLPAIGLHDERQRSVFDAGLKGFVNEARLLAQFDHPALVKVHRFWQQNGTAYMVMPYYQGVTLRELLKSSGPPDERWLLRFLDEVTGALRVVHAENWYHRDIAPDNILMLSESGKPLLLDFGAARQVIGDATQALTAILKPGYAPIEQYAEIASLKQGPWTDVYALCAVVYATIAGSKPPVAIGRTVRDSYEPLAAKAGARYSRPFLEAIDAGLRLRPEQRPADMAALRQMLGLDGGAQGRGDSPHLAGQGPVGRSSSAFTTPGIAEEPTTQFVGRTPGAVGPLPAAVRPMPADRHASVHSVPVPGSAPGLQAQGILDRSPTPRPNRPFGMAKVVTVLVAAAVLALGLAVWWWLGSR